jgi:hypothetical protein
VEELVYVNTEKNEVIVKIAEGVKCANTVNANQGARIVAVLVSVNIIGKELFVKNVAGLVFANINDNEMFVKNVVDLVSVNISE